MTIAANAQPEKRLFISLLTRDISLVDAILDILDNSINAAMTRYAEHLTDAKGYYGLLSNNDIKPAAVVKIEITNQAVNIIDNAGGISLEAARDRVFAFGKADHIGATADRLSVYGIGLKRAIFKMGNRIEIYSNHPAKGFELDLDASWWETQTETPWNIPITEAVYDPSAEAGTIICVTQLFDDVSRRIDDATFVNELKVRISRTYCYFLGRIVTIYVNEEEIKATEFLIGSNYTHNAFEQGTVSYSITAGIAVPVGGRYQQETSGWFVFCNGRTVIYADKTQLTGWASLLPIFQPKHRPFLGLVFFVSAYPEDLPWTTTKASVNQESLIWQEAKRNMAILGREITSFLDRRYTDEGTEVAPDELAEASGSNISLLSASVAAKKAFEVPAPRPPEDVSIQYSAKISHVDKIRRYLGRRAMSAREVGKYTFDYFYKNEANP